MKKEDEKKIISHFSFILYVFDMSFDNSFTIQQDKNWLVTCHISGCWCGFLVEFMLNYVFDDIWIIKYTYRHLNSIWNTTKHIILFSSVYIEHSNIDFFDKHTINLLIFATTLFCDLKEINRSIFHKILYILWKRLLGRGYYFRGKMHLYLQLLHEGSCNLFFIVGLLFLRMK